MSSKRKANAMAAATAAATASVINSKNDNDADDAPPPSPSSDSLVKHHAEMMDACAAGECATVLSLLDAAATDDAADDGESKTKKSNNNLNLSQKQLLAAQQSPTTGQSPLMVAAQHGHVDICQLLLDAGAPWNAIDRYGKCAGDFATENEQWNVVNLLVEAGTKAELILGASIRLAKLLENTSSSTSNNSTNTADETEATTHNTKKANDTNHNDTNTTQTDPNMNMPVSHEPCTKPDYLQHQNVRYNAANTLLLDNDDDAVMMEWERPLMNAHADILTHNGTKQHKKRVLNIGFGLGIIDTALQTYEPSLHIIIEAHPTVYQKMISDGWDAKPNVRICFGRWQDELPKLIEEGIVLDGIFYDTYGEHFTDLEDFHEMMVKVLSKPDGIYSFFNGLAPDNLFFHGVACNCVKIQLEHLGLETEFAQCEIQVDEKDWEGVRRKYWHGRNTYYLPICTWKKAEEEGKEAAK